MTRWTWGKAWPLDPLAWVAVLLAAASVWVVVGLAGCADAEAGIVNPAPEESTVEVRTARGVRVVVLRQLALHYPALVEQCKTLIDTTAPDADSRIARGTRGVPTTMTVYVRQSGAFPVRGGFALGSTDMQSRMWLALRRCSKPGDPLLPALGHELRHVYTGDGAAGH